MAKFECPPFSPPSLVQVLTQNEGPCRASRPAHVLSALRGNELRQKVLWVPRKGARRRADFCTARYEQCTASMKTTSRFRWQAVPLQTEGAKIHAPPGTLPWKPRYLLRPYCDRSRPQARPLATPRRRCRQALASGEGAADPEAPPSANRAERTVVTAASAAQTVAWPPIQRADRHSDPAARTCSCGHAAPPDACG